MNHIRYYPSICLNQEELLQKSTELHQLMESRRSLRFFSQQPVEKQVIENVILTASTAPSGANKQPWTFCAISSPMLKRKIREAAEGRRIP